MTEKKNIGKEILHNSFQSLEIAAVLFIVIGMVIDITNHGNMDFTDYDFTRMALACLLIGPGFGVPSAIYKNDRSRSASRSLSIWGSAALSCCSAHTWPAGSRPRRARGLSSPQSRRKSPQHS